MRILAIIGTWFYLVFWWHMQTHSHQWTIVNSTYEKCTVFTTPHAINARLEEGHAPLEVSTRSHRLTNNHQEDSRTQHKGGLELSGCTTVSANIIQWLRLRDLPWLASSVNFAFFVSHKFIIYHQLRI